MCSIRHFLFKAGTVFFDKTEYLLKNKKLNINFHSLFYPMDYLSSLNEKERKAYEIAKLHLGPLFIMEQSNGYLNWTAKRALYDR